MNTKLAFTKVSMIGLILLTLVGGLAASPPARAAPGLRAQVNQHGDFVLIGNTFGQECAAGTPAPVVGTVGDCGSSGTTDSAPDVFWRADSPADGQAEANTGITVAQARSTAMLTLPAGAQVTHAYLYWAAMLTAGSDTTATLDRPGAGGFTASLTALETLSVGNPSRYRSVADVTTLVQTNGAGAYRVSEVNMNNWVNVTDSNNFSGWWMVVLYRLDSDPLRNLTIFDGMDPVANGLSQNSTLAGFEVPASGTIDGKLGVVAMEGDNTGVGDAFAFNGTTLSNAQNLSNNFFNSTHSYLGTAVSGAGDLPQLAGTPQSMSGIDLDVVDISPYLTPGQTSAPIAATTTGDVYFLTTFVTSITTYKPQIAVSGNSVAITSGDTTPSTTDGTDFGSAIVGSSPVVHTLTINNTGNADLTVNTITPTGGNASDFTVSGLTLPAIVAANSSATFNVTFTPGAAGVRTATVSIANNDTTQNPYTFATQGLGIVQINSSVSQLSVTTGVYNPSLVACGATSLANQTVTPTLHNNTGSTFSNLFFKVKTLEYKVAQGGQTPKLCNADTPGDGVGATLTIAGSLAANSDLLPATSFVVGLPVRAAYRFFVDFYSSSATAANGATGADAGYLGSFEYEVDESGQLVSSQNTLFLPLVQR